MLAQNEGIGVVCRRHAVKHFNGRMFYCLDGEGSSGKVERGRALKYPRQNKVRATGTTSVALEVVCLAG